MDTSEALFLILAVLVVLGLVGGLMVGPDNFYLNPAKPLRTLFRFAHMLTPDRLELHGTLVQGSTWS
jgi:hypothetical protein